MSDAPLLNTHGRSPLAFERASGVWLYDTNGQRYLDTYSGIAVCGLGHSHPAVTEAVSKQAATLVHCPNILHSPVQQELAQRLCAVAQMERVFFANSGAEANETAIKLARLYGHQKGISAPAIIVMERAFHGKTLATLSATGNRKVQAGFEPLVSGFIRAQLNNIQSIESIARSNPAVVAVLLEPIQGEGGVYEADPVYLKALRRICDQQGWLLMMDEVQSGNGRTGSWFAWQQLGTTPDVVTTAKGVPIGACLARGAAANIFRSGQHGSAFGGNPLACAAALAVVQTIEEQNLCQRAAQLGERLLADFRYHFEGTDYIRDIRGRGLMIGIELCDPCPELVPLAKARQLLLNITADKVIRLLPALTMSDEEADLMVDQVTRIIKLYAADDRLLPRR